jgi:ribosomal protein S18 acetylase RimI-like enzyme
MLKIREVCHQDLDSIKDLLIELQETTQTQEDLRSIDFDDMLDEMRHLPSIYSNIVAVDDKKAVGFLSMICYKTFLHRGGTALITELIISKSCRRKGIGRMLIEKAVEIAKQNGMDELEVGTEKENNIAKTFYRNTGFNIEYVLFGKTFSDPA